MSYNVDNWKQKRCEDFTIPLKAIRAIPKLEVRITSAGAVVTGSVECLRISGTIVDRVFIVETIYYAGGGSGHSWEAFLDLLATGGGLYEAVAIWEGGDSITRVIIDNGTVKEEPIEL